MKPNHCHDCTCMASTGCLPGTLQGQVSLLARADACHKNDTLIWLYFQLVRNMVLSVYETALQQHHSICISITLKYNACRTKVQFAKTTS